MFKNFILLSLLSILAASCASQLLEDEKFEEFQTNEEYDQMVVVKEIPPEPSEKEKKPPVKEKKKEVKKKAPPPKKVEKPVKKEEQKVIEVRQPEFEDSEGFIGRRPSVDPYRVGEKTVLAIKYFKVKAGTMTFETLPFTEVNGRRSYHFAIRVKSNKAFSWVYKVDDWAETYLDYEMMVPHAMNVHVNESKNVKEIKTFLDYKGLKGNYWEKKMQKDGTEKKKRKKWAIKPFSQDAISAFYYLRSFVLTPKKVIKFNVADDGKNIVLTGRVIRKEVLDTDIGKIKTVVVKPEFKVKGVFKPVGDIFFWFTDDEFKQIVRFESKIKIGTLVGELVSMHRP